SQFEENGVLFVGDRAMLFVNREQLFGSAVDELARYPLPRNALRLYPSPARRWGSLVYHVRDFFECIQTGRQPVSEVVGQHRATSACHLANIAMRVGRKLTWDARAEQIVGDPEANAMLSRLQRAPYQLPAA